MSWRTSDGDATAGADYTASEGVLSVPAGALDARIFVPLLDDRLDEADETFTIELSEPAGVALANTRVVGTILDDDAEPALLIGDATASEGDGAPRFLRLARLGQRKDGHRGLRHPRGHGDRGVDYRTASGTLTIPPGSPGRPSGSRSWTTGSMRTTRRWSWF